MPETETNTTPDPRGVQIGELPEFSGIGRKEFRVWRKAMHDIPIENLPEFWKSFERATEGRKYRQFRSEMLSAIEGRLINSLPLEAQKKWQRKVVEKYMTFEEIYSFYVKEVE